MKTRYLFLAALFARLLFFIFVYDSEAWNFHMASRFDERALAIARGDTISNLAGWGSYPLYVAVFYKLFDLLGLLAFRLEILYWLHQIFGLVCAYLIGRILDRWQVRRAISLTTISVLILFNPMQIYVNSMNISESLFQLSTTMMLALLLGVFALKAPWRWLAFFGCLGVSILARNIVLPFVLLLPFYLLFFHKESPSPLRQKWFWLGTLVTVVMLYGAGLLNSRFDSRGNPSLNSNRGPNLAQTWCEAARIHFKTDVNEFWFSPPDFWNLPRTSSLFLEKDFDDSPYYTALAWDCIKKDPAIMGTRLRSFLNIFDGPIYPNPWKEPGTKLSEAYSYVYLTIFLVLLFATPILWQRQPQSRVFYLFILGCLGAVYGANIGEARFLYSFLPALTVLAGLSWHSLPKKPLLGIALVSVIFSGLSSQVPSLGRLIDHRERDRFLALSKEEKLAKVEESLARLPSAGEPDASAYCAATEEKYFPVSKQCLSQAGSCEPLKESLLNEWNALRSHPWSEEDLFCRNLEMLRLFQDKQVRLPGNVIQKPSPLPRGIEAFHPLVAVAGQLLHVEMLHQIGQSQVVDPAESRELLVYTLLKYQHRSEYNRAEYQGAIVEDLKKEDVAEPMNGIYRETLRRVIRSGF